MTFNSRLPSSLASSPYLEGLPVRQHVQTINFMVFGRGDNLTRYMRDRCVEHTPSRGLASREWHCGETILMEIAEADLMNDVGREELKIRLGGHLRFSAAAVRGSGWFSNNILGRQLARDAYSRLNVPHAVIIDDQQPLQLTDYVTAQCRGKNVPAYRMTDDVASLAGDLRVGVKGRLIKALLKEKEENVREEAFQKGVREGKKQEAAAMMRELARQEEQKRKQQKQDQRGNSPADDEAFAKGFSAGQADALKSFDPASLPEYLCCPITLAPLQDPVITPRGHTYERTAIEATLRSTHTDPITRERWDVADLTPNRWAKDMMEWLRKNS